MELCNDHRGVQLDYKYDEATSRSTLRYELPLSEIATEFFSKLKSRSVKACDLEYLADPMICILPVIGARVMPRLTTRMLDINRVT
jgi:translation elongation factor EF-4